MAKKVKKITFLIRSLAKGGAERQLVALGTGLKLCGTDVSVVVFYTCDNGFEGDLKKADIRVISLNKKGRWDVVPFLFRLVKTLRAERADVIHSYLDVSNLLVAIFKRVLRPAKIVWGVRASAMNFSRYDFWLGFTNAFTAKVAKFADLIIVNSTAGRDAVLKEGYPADRTIVINNGIDTDKFDINNEKRISARKAWAITAETKVVVMSARIDPMKGHDIFLKAVGKFKSNQNDIFFVLAGGGPQNLLKSLKELAAKLGIEDRLLWLGEVDDMLEIYNGADVATLASSFGEGFPNVVGEAMACGVSCVVTDVGSAANIVGKTGRVVPPENPVVLAAAWESMFIDIENNKDALQQSARERIIKNFSVKKLIDETMQAFDGL